MSHYHWHRGVASAAPVTFFDFNSDGAADTTLTVPSIGASFSADLYFDFAGSEDLGGIQSMGVQVTYDFTQINVTAVAANGANWFIPDIPNTGFDNTIGLASIAGGRFGGLTNSPILLGSMDFLCMGAGISSLVMGELLPGNPTFDAFVSPTGYVFDKDIVYGSAEVSQVPIPGAIWLLGSGLLGLIGLRRRAKKE